MEKEKISEAEVVEGVKEKEQKMIVIRNDFSLQDLRTIADDIFKARIYSSIQNKEQALAKILAGRELSIPPMLSLAKIYIVDGKVAVEGEILADLIKRTNGEYDFKILRLDTKGCILQFLKKGKPIDDELEGKVQFTEEDASRARLLGKANWTMYPEEMYYWRTLAKGARRYCPHLIHGCYLKDELGVDDNYKQDENKIVIEPIEVKETKKAKEVKDEVVIEPIKESKENETKETKKTEVKETKEVKEEVKKAEEIIIEPVKEKKKNEKSERELKIKELKEKYGLSLLKIVKGNLKINIALKDVDEETFNLFLDKLKEHDKES